MAKEKVILGVVAACAACCAVPIALPFLVAAFAGAGLAGIGAVASAWWLAAAGLALAAGAAAIYVRRRRTARGCEEAGA